MVFFVGDRDVGEDHSVIRIEVLDFFLLLLASPSAVRATGASSARRLGAAISRRRTRAPLAVGEECTSQYKNNGWHNAGSQADLPSHQFTSAARMACPKRTDSPGPSAMM